MLGEDVGVEDGGGGVQVGLNTFELNPSIALIANLVWGHSSLELVLDPEFVSGLYRFGSKRFSGEDLGWLEENFLSSSSASIEIGLATEPATVPERSLDKTSILDLTILQLTLLQLTTLYSSTAGSTAGSALGIQPK